MEQIIVISANLPLLQCGSNAPEGLGSWSLALRAWASGLRLGIQGSWVPETPKTPRPGQGQAGPGQG